MRIYSYSVLTFNSCIDYSPSIPFIEGRCHEASRWWSGTQRSRAGGQRTPLAPERRRGTRKQVYAVCAMQTAFVGGTMTSRQELADGGPPKHAVARSAARRRQDAAWSAAGRSVLVATGTGHAPPERGFYWAPRGAPSPSTFCRGSTPPAPWGTRK